MFLFTELVVEWNNSGIDFDCNCNDCFLFSQSCVLPLLSLRNPRVAKEWSSREWRDFNFRFSVCDLPDDGKTKGWILHLAAVCRLAGGMGDRWQDQ